MITRIGRIISPMDSHPSVGYTSNFDFRHWFSHGRRWHIRMGGRRPFDDIRSSARLHIGIHHLRLYLSKTKDPRQQQLNIEILKAQFSGKKSNSAWKRAENAKTRKFSQIVGVSAEAVRPRALRRVS